MDKADLEKNGAGADESIQLNRNRSFKSKQLVRSQAIRESQSPPRAISPAVPHRNISSPSTPEIPSPASETTTSQTFALSPTVTQWSAIVASSPQTSPITVSAPQLTASQPTHASTDIRDALVDCVSECDTRKRPVAIQITPGASECSEQGSSEQRQRTKRWLVYKNYSDSSRDLLSKDPRVACICGACAACPHCRGRRRRQQCPTKQDSGIVCSDDCPDCCDNEHTGLGEHIIRKCGSLDADDQTYCRCPERKERPRYNSFTRTDSDEKIEPTGSELVNFIKETLNKNPKDRMTMLKIEKELHALINDSGRCIVRFPVMTSYGRMLVHRCATLFQLSHHSDQNNKNSVLVSKSGTSGGRIPCTPFKFWCTATFPPSPQRHHEPHAKSILKRDTLGGGEGMNGGGLCARSKSLEQREREYERVRRRIFSTDNCSQDELWPWMSGPVRLLTPESGRNKLLKVQSLEGPGSLPRPPWRCRGPVSKSHSFSGYGNINNNNSVDLPPHPRLLSRQGDLASSSWRLSPSSSGYKTLSLRSTDSVTPSPTGGASPEPCAGAAANPTLGPAVGEGSVVWAVTDMSAVPPGAIVIHPQTGRPLTNPDGSIYHFDPANPPVVYDQNSYNHAEQKTDVNAEKRRGRLEKQNSFIDNDCECQTLENSRDKCSCECRKHDGCKQKSNTEKETNEIPSSPIKTHDETQTTDPKPPYEASTNHKQPHETTTNEKQSYETATNQNQPCDATPNQTQESQLQFEQSTNQKPSGEYTNSQRAESQRSLEQQREQPNQRPVGEVQAVPLKPPSREGQELQYRQAYGPQFRPEEVTSPQMNNHLVQQEIVDIQNAMAQAKITPMPMPDPNIRPVSLTNMMYQTPVPQGYTYINPTRVDHQPIPQPIYQQLVHQQPEEPKQLTASPHNEGTFRIDPSYPYAAVDYTAACGGCVDPNAIHQQQRSYSVPYGQVDMAGAVIPPTYPVGNVILPQPHMQPYPYQEAVPWSGVPQPMSATPKLYVHEMYPVMQYSTPYPQYNIMYPQVIPQPYPICQPIYPTTDKAEQYARRNSASNHRPKYNSVPQSARNTPVTATPDDKKVAGDERKVANDGRSCGEIAARIQRMREQLNEREREKEKRDEWSRNNGTGILGCYPNGGPNVRLAGPPSNDESQLSSAAKAIVNTIRSMQSKSTCPRGQKSTSDFFIKNHLNAALWMESMSPGTWCRRSPGPVHPVLNNPRRPHPDARNYRR
ncbi:hypothetical protein K1T71_014278 [Dendrolimus kikuchii]|uniref:Uncharacterized protein n=1 Tax=Dendrolimus kikuchii TaxID=765133 RepID=A0ACC1CFR4_9NEOP|nr:hypothetical protein K1T71_014278 [Dendrolimus kikuchii]